MGNDDAEDSEAEADTDVDGELEVDVETTEVEDDELEKERPLPVGYVKVVLLPAGYGAVDSDVEDVKEPDIDVDEVVDIAEVDKLFDACMSRLP